MTSDPDHESGRPDWFDAPRSAPEHFGHPASREARIAAAHTQARRRRRITMTVVAAALAAAGITTLAVAWPDGHDSDATGAAHGLPTNAASDPPSPTRDPAADGAPAPIVSNSSDGARQPTPPPAGTPTTAPVPPPPAGTVGLPLSGRVVMIDPGHNPGNGDHTREINKQVYAGGLTKECDTTGTETNKGYTEAAFTLDVAQRVRRLLEAQGATVLYTWETEAWGPCVDQRAARGNAAEADAIVSIHADGGPSGGRGFHVILPGSVKAKDADTTPILAPSRELGTSLAAAFRAATGTGPATYLGTSDGLVTRTDLGGLNLSTRPKVFIECGNMRNAADAAQFTDPNWRERAASGIATGITAYLLKVT
ncbi:N-acetylmuramoyl-L-alanine amidase [Embleya sp. NBC_00896]|uniref:N-acetylmuramoyl-L-alanine amidase n=1 Tax=Embleya sp. NBC_00896 TaxID=2975961 RepID=UPI00386942D5|nr:N-acetylmuramoyl-L-alanine amidase [Embleya sp. NBC_00896]